MQTIRTQDIPEAKERAEFYALDPDFVTQPHGRIPMSGSVIAGLVLLRVYLLVVAGVLAFRFAQYAHWVN
jgi:hypothetical protein